MSYNMDKDTYSCDFCGIDMKWDETHPENGDMWGCEVCGKTFCSKCLKDKVGVLNYYMILQGNNLVLCPDCAEREGYGRKTAEKCV